MDDPIAFLGLRAGRYAGPGIGHDRREFTGVLVIEPKLNPATLVYRFTATARDGEILHREVACLGQGASGDFEIVHANSNVPGLQRFRLAEGAEDELVMVHGDLADQDSFREIVRLRFISETEAMLQYDWALYGDAMKPQSQVRLIRETP